MLPNDPFFRSSMPSAVVAERPDEAAREQRIRWLGEAARDLLDGKLPADEARVFLAGALLAWLENGGRLERSYLRTSRAKSHITATVIWKRLRAHRDEDAPR